YGFLRDTQRGDGSWPLKWQDGVAESTDTDANFCAYVAVGVWHHHLVTARAGFLESMWPTVRRALDLVLAHQGPQGQMWWGSSERGAGRARHVGAARGWPRGGGWGRPRGRGSRGVAAAPGGARPPAGRPAGGAAGGRRPAAAPAGAAAATSIITPSLAANLS